MLPQFNKQSWSDFPLRELVDEVAQSLASRCKDQSIKVILDVPADLTATGNRGLIRRAVEHLMLGAIAAMPKGGSLWATSAAGPTPSNSKSPTLGRRCRTKPAATPSILPATPSAAPRAGSWPMVYHIAKIHGGSVTAANCPEGGAAFTLRIPRRAALEAAA